MVKARFVIEDGVLVFIFNKRRYPMSCRDISRIIAERKVMQFSSALDPNARCTLQYRKNRLQFHVEGNVFVLPVGHYEGLVREAAGRGKGSGKKELKTYELDSLDDKGPTMVPPAPVDPAGRGKNDSMEERMSDTPARESIDLDRLNLMNDMQRMKK